MKKFALFFLLFYFIEALSVSAQVVYPRRPQIWPGVDMPLPQNPAYIYDAAGPLGVPSPYVPNALTNSQFAYSQQFYATGQDFYGFNQGFNQLGMNMFPPSTGTIILYGVGNGINTAAQMSFTADQQRFFYQNAQSRRVYRQPPPPRRRMPYYYR